MRRALKHIKLKSYTFDVDLEKIYLIEGLGPCLKTKSWDYYLPIYGNYEAIELKDINQIKVTLSPENADEDTLQFYRKEFLQQLNRYNSKVVLIGFHVSEKDKEKYIKENN